jgi:hypothetical protein
LAENPGERPAPGVFKEQHGPLVFAHKRQRPRCRPTVQFVLQFVFMRQLINEGRRGVFRGGEHGKHGGPFAITVIAPSSAEDALAILQQYREATNPARAE